MKLVLNNRNSTTSRTVNKVASTTCNTSSSVILRILLHILVLGFSLHVAAQSVNCTAETDVVATKLKFDSVDKRCTTSAGPCTADFSPYVTTYKSECLNASGAFSTKNITYICNGNGKSVTITVISFPICVGSSCTEADINALLNNQVEAFNTNATQVYSTNIQCTVASAARTTRSLYILITTSAFSILSIVLIF